MIVTPSTLRVPTDDADKIRGCTLRLRCAQKHWNQRRAVRLIGVGAHNLIEASTARQLEFDGLSF